MIEPFVAQNDLQHTAWNTQVSSPMLTTRSVLRACFGWVCELGIRQEMPYYQKKTLALINGVAFVSLLLALPATFILLLMGFGHPFSLLVIGVMTACLILGFNGSKHAEWSKITFAFAPAAIILAYSLVELSSQGLDLPLNYLLLRQGLCLALLLPPLIYGFESTQKSTILLAICLLAFIGYDVASMQLGAFRNELIDGVNHGLFSVLSLLQYAGLSTCVLYVQKQSMRQIVETTRANEKLKKLAIRDSLTGLFNHGFMEQLIRDAINRTRRSQTPLTLLMIDLDNFKQVNDSFGHNAGDEVLLRLTRLLNQNKRSTDYLGRWGGDELILLLTDTNLAGADNLAEKLRDLVVGHMFPYGIHLSISLGASEYSHGETPSSFIARADAAMYRAKRSGRNKVEISENSQRDLVIIG